MKSRAIVFQSLNSPVLAEVDIPPPGPGEILVRTTLSGISPGTELRCAAGREGGPDSFPFVPGYALVGTVVEVGPGVPMPLGTRVFAKGTRAASGAKLMWGGHVEYAVVDEAAVVRVPDGVGDVDAALGALGAIAYHGFRLAAPGAADTVAVVGLGPLGQLSARLFQTVAKRVVACDRNARRVALARQGGVEAYEAPGSPLEALGGAIPEGADIVVDATGVPAVLPQALELARSVPWTEDRPAGPKYVVQGSYAGDFAVPYGAAFQKEVTFLVPRDRLLADIAAFLNLLATGSIRVDGIVGGIFAPSEAQTVYDALRSPDPVHLTAAFRWSPDSECPAS